MNREEQLKQAIEEHDKVYESFPIKKEDFKNGMLYAVNEPSILRHADPEIMKQAGWVREEEWISVEDRLPNYGDKVLLFIDHGDSQIFEFVIWDKEEERFYKMNNITHWKPLPNPPKQ